MQEASGVDLLEYDFATEGFLQEGTVRDPCISFHMFWLKQLLKKDRRLSVIGRRWVRERERGVGSTLRDTLKGSLSPLLI